MDRLSSKMLGTKIKNAKQIYIPPNLFQLINNVALTISGHGESKIWSSSKDP